MIDRHVLGGGEAVVRLDTVNLPYRLEVGAFQRIQNGTARMRQDVGVVSALADLPVEFQIGGPMTPSQNPRHSFKSGTTQFCIRSRILF